MKLISKKFQKHIIFSENTINVIRIENSRLFTQIIEELMYQSEGNEGSFILSQENEILNIQKHIDIIYSPLMLEINQKRIVNKLYSTIRNYALMDFSLETMEIETSIYQYILSLVNNIEGPITLQDNFDINGLLKLFDVKFSFEESSLISRLYDYLKVAHYYSDTKCFVFINLKSYLNNDEIEALYQFVNLSKINVLLLESGSIDFLSEYEETLVIDKDLCEIY
jgi:CRISPR-associated protein Csn2